MTPEEYAAAQAVISAAVARYVLAFTQFYTIPALTFTDWVNLLQLIYPEIERRRTESADLARTFYDYQREQNHPDLPRNDRPLEGTTFETFVDDMEPVRQRMSQEASQEAAQALALRAVREVENAGRQQIIHAVQNDKARVIRGWARVATGRETCAWCLMLISRGPVYYGADTAGLDLDDDLAAEMILNGEDVSEYMEQWHTGCDCKVVPVFKQENWFGQEAADRALELWNDASKVATLLMKADPFMEHTAGKRKGKPFTKNEVTINVLRQMLQDGDIDATEFAALAA